MFDPGRPFQPNIIFADKARSLPMSGTLKGEGSRFTGNKTLGLKGLPGTNTFTSICKLRP